MRLIDADALQKEYQKEHGKRLLLIDVAPTIDAVEVVRCKDCKYKDDCSQMIKFRRHVDLDHRYNKLHYCSYGERKEE